MSKEKRRWNIPVPQTLDDAVEKAIVLDTHMTKSDLIREAVREKLEKMGFKNEPFQEAAPNGQSR